MRAYELLKQQAEQIAVLSADKARLDYLDRCNEALNRQTGSNYQWSLIQSHNVNRLMLEHFAVDLHDSAPASQGLPSCRDAIDQRMREVEARRPRPYISTIPAEIAPNYRNRNDGQPVMERLHMWPRSDGSTTPCDPRGCRECERERTWKEGQTHGL
jgi:hypothetical protein